MSIARLILVVVAWTVACSIPGRAQQTIQSTDSKLPSWTKMTGARTEPKRKRSCSPNSFGAKAGGITTSTFAIQKAIDECSRAGGGVVTFEKGEYLTGALFLKNNIDLRVN